VAIAVPHPLVTVYLAVSSPFDTAVTKPDVLFTVAFALPILQVPPPARIAQCIGIPCAQRTIACNSSRIGQWVTVTVTDALLLQVFDAVPVTVYEVVDDGLAVTLAPVVADKPVAGDHE